MSPAAGPYDLSSPAGACISLDVDGEVLEPSSGYAGGPDASDPPGMPDLDTGLDIDLLLSAMRTTMQRHTHTQRPHQQHGYQHQVYPHSRSQPVQATPHSPVHARTCLPSSASANVPGPGEGGGEVGAGVGVGAHASRFSQLSCQSEGSDSAVNHSAHSRYVSNGWHCCSCRCCCCCCCCCPLFPCAMNSHTDHTVTEA